MECRLRWRLCRSPGILPALQRQSSNPFPGRRPATRSTITDSPSRRTVRPYLFIVRGAGGGRPFVSATPGILILSPLSSNPPSPSPSIINHSTTESLVVLLFPRLELWASSFLSQHVQVPGLFSFSARYPSFNDLGPTRLPREWRLSGSANDLVSSTTKCGNFWTDRSSRERLS